MMKETKENRIDAVRAFLAAANKQFEAQGIYLERVLLKRDENGSLTGITLSYEDRGQGTTPVRSLTDGRTQM